MTSEAKVASSGDDRAARRRRRRAAVLSLICAIFFIVPNFNVFDLLPDFVAYLIIGSFFKKYAEYAPYFDEAASAFRKLTLISVSKIPASMIMFVNISTGQDIVVLFSFSYAVLELLFLYPAIKNAFSALYYVGERADCPSAIRGIRAFGTSIGAESIEPICLVYVTVRAILNVIPDFFLLTQIESELEAATRAMFPVATVITMSLSLIVGIAVCVIVRKYVMQIAREGKFAQAVLYVAGEEKLTRLKRDATVKRKLSTMSLLFIAALLSFDVVFDNVLRGVNLLPHAVMGIIMLIVCLRVFDKGVFKILTAISGILYIVSSLVAHYFVADFLGEFGYLDLGFLTTADEAYVPVMISSAVETVCFIIFMGFFTYCFTKFVIGNTLPELGGGIDRTTEEYIKSMKRKCIIYTAFPSAIALFKFINTLLRSEVHYVMPDASDAPVSAIPTTVLPWFGFFILAVCIAFILYSYYFSGDLKEEIRMKYADEMQSYE